MNVQELLDKKKILTNRTDLYNHLYHLVPLFACFYVCYILNVEQRNIAAIGIKKPPVSRGLRKIITFFFWASSPHLALMFGLNADRRHCLRLFVD